MTPAARRLGQLAGRELAASLGGAGVVLDVGLVRTRVRAPAALAGPLQGVYRHFAAEPAATWADLDVQIVAGGALRRWWRPQVVFRSDRRTPFAPFPATHALPLLEWGVNWLIGQRVNHLLLLHAGVVERHGAALVMPALPGSGKSTLAAALSLTGWRLLSDEFGAWDAGSQRFWPVLKPVALKNGSIDVIRSLVHDAPLGPSFERTRKGTVAHLAPSRHAVDLRHQGARPGALVLPQWRPGSATRLERVGRGTAFSSLAFNAFNYAVQGPDGFTAVARLSEDMPAWRLVYSDLDDALRQIDELWSRLGLDEGAALPRPRQAACGSPR